MGEQEMAQEVERYMALPYRIELTPSGGRWFIRIPDLPYCMSQGDTVEEAIEMIRDAQRGWLTVSLEQGDSIPAPTEPTYSGEDYSGRFNIRLPKTIHRDLVRLADAEGVSLNLLAATILAQALGRKDVATRKPGRPRRIAEGTVGYGLPAREESDALDEARSTPG